MAFTANILDCLIPITQFNKGQASRIFDRLRTEKQLIVLKNNAPSAVILSPEEYARLAEIEEDYALLLEATSRLSESTSKSALSFDTVLSNLGISEDDLNDAEDIVIE
ncbi:MAG: type II toxin-antitoxin system Phd/YefM family antitoxin [Cellulosilyticaceae bacterium]